MSIVDDVSKQLKQAMKARDKARTTALRNMRAALLDEIKAGPAGRTLGDQQAEEVLRRLAKQRKESIEAYAQGGRDELASAEKAELSVIQEFLPELATEDQTREWVRQAIRDTGAQDASDLGKVMGKVMGGHKGEVDGALANRIARAELSEG